MDSSNSIGARDFIQIKFFLISLLSKFVVGEQAAKFSIVVFSTDPSLLLTFAEQVKETDIGKVKIFTCCNCDC